MDERPSSVDDHNVDLLASALEALSTNDPVSVLPPQAHTPPAPLPLSISPVTTPRRGRKFYSVTIGKRCGVFDKWSYAKTLVDGVSKATFTGFKVYDDAVKDYFEAKAAGLVRVVRDPGDELIYGPLSKAVM